MEVTEETIKQYEPMVAKIARRYAKLQLPLEDLMQVGRAAIVEGCQSYDRRDNVQLSSWIFTKILGRIRHYNRDKKGIVRALRNGDSPVISPIDDYLFTLAAESVDIDTMIYLKQILSKLPDDLHEVMWLHDGCGETAIQIARRIGMSESTVFYRLAKARAMARAIGSAMEEEEHLILSV